MGLYLISEVLWKPENVKIFRATIVRRQFSPVKWFFHLGGDTEYENLKKRYGVVESGVKGFFKR